jgi:hypothetical protein
MPKPKNKITMPKHFKKPHMGVYCIIINQYIYIGESFDLERRWKQHIEDLKNNRHHNKILQEQYNKNNGYMKIECICCIAYSYLRFVYCKQYFKFNDEKNIVNLLKIILLCIEHKIINEYQHDTQYIVCNSENTLLKIYHLLTNNEQQYLKQFYIIIKDNYNKYGIINKQSYIINIIKLFYLNKTILNNISQINILNLKSVLSDNIEAYYI